MGEEDIITIILFRVVGFMLLLLSKIIFLNVTMFAIEVIIPRG